MTLKADIRIDQLIYKLICLYAFFIPLEKILEIYFGIETVLKPYRIFAIIIIGVFVIRTRFKWTSNSAFSRDIFLYLVFIYGLLATCLRMVTSSFNLSLFINDAFQITLYLGVFVVIRHINFSRSQVNRILASFVAGVFANSLYFFTNFFFNQLYMREGGFMDNPNYMSLSAVISVLFLIVNYPNTKGLLKRSILILGTFFLGYIIIIGGSRTSFAILVLAILMIIFLTPGKTRGALLSLSLVLTLFLSLGGWSLVQGAGPVILVNRLSKSSSNDNRLPIREGVIKGAESSNYLGLGIGQFKANFREFYPDENNSLIRRIVDRNYFLSPHSDYLALIAIYGIVGLICYLMFIYLSLKHVLSLYLGAQSPDEQRHFQLNTIILISLILFGLTNENFLSSMFWLLLAISTKTGLSYNYKVHTNSI